MQKAFGTWPSPITAEAVALHIQRAGVFIQAAGHDIVNGPIGMATLGSADILDAAINGDVNIDNHSVVNLRSASTTVNGNIDLARDSGLLLEGPVIINGSVTCDGDESRLYSTEGIVAGGVFDTQQDAHIVGIGGCQVRRAVAVEVADRKSAGAVAGREDQSQQSNRRRNRRAQL